MSDPDYDLADGDDIGDAVGYLEIPEEGMLDSGYLAVTPEWCKRMCLPFAYTSPSHSGDGVPWSRCSEQNGLMSHQPWFRADRSSSDYSRKDAVAGFC